MKNNLLYYNSSIKYTPIYFETKKCSKCKVIKSFNKFCKNKSNKDGYTSQCKECKKEIDRAYRRRNSGKLSIKRRKLYVKNKSRIVNSQKIYLRSKKCFKCGIIKDRDEFNEDRIKKDGLSSYCKLCKRRFDIKYINKNRKIISEKNKAYRNKNKNKLRTKQKEWTELNKSKIKIRKRKYHLKQYQNNIQYKLSHLLRTRLKVAIKKGWKSGSAVCDLGCSISFLKSYLESKFQPEMTWDNHGSGYGKWNVDHIKPLSSFDLTDRSQFLEACHYTNLQPLWFEDNIKKSDKLVYHRKVS